MNLESFQRLSGVNQDRICKFVTENSLKDMNNFAYNNNDVLKLPPNLQVKLPNLDQMMSRMNMKTNTLNDPLHDSVKKQILTDYDKRSTPPQQNRTQSANTPTVQQGTPIKEDLFTLQKMESAFNVFQVAADFLKLGYSTYKVFNPDKPQTPNNPGHPAQQQAPELPNDEQQNYYEIATELIIEGEGLKPAQPNGLYRQYKCSVGYQTIGYGHKLLANEIADVIEIDKRQVDAYLVQDMKIAIKQVKKEFSTEVWNSLEPVRQAVLVDLVFNMGSLGKFPQFKAAINKRDFAEATNQLKYADVAETKLSEYYIQVHTRADRNCKILKTGIKCRKEK